MNRAGRDTLLCAAFWIVYFWTFVLVATCAVVVATHRLDDRQTGAYCCGERHAPAR
ncbi:MAG TPA: hypothetical protein VMU87_18115 [Stellaceae bacterium]|nr:hypothetical protein [Stellaceae bacterium]